MAQVSLEISSATSRENPALDLSHLNKATPAAKSLQAKRRGQRGASTRSPCELLQNERPVRREQNEPKFLRHAKLLQHPCLVVMTVWEKQ